MIYSPLEFSEAVAKFVPPIHSVNLPENENIVEPEDTSEAREIDQMLKIHKLERKCSLNGDTCINFFKIANDEDPFQVKWYGGDENEMCQGIQEWTNGAIVFKNGPRYSRMDQWSNGLVVKALDSHQEVPCSKPLGGSKVDSGFHTSEVDKMSTRNFWELSGEK